MMLVAKSSITAQILMQLRKDIVDCRYDEFALITEGEVSERFQVSKTPAREALNYLCQEGLVEKLPHRGYLIKRFSMRELENLFQFRSILESAAVDIAVQTASDEELIRLRQLAEKRVELGVVEPYLQYSQLNFDFHIALAGLSKNPILVSTLNNVLNQLRRALTLDWKCTDVNVLLQGHSRLVDAMLQRDRTLCMQLVQQESTCAETRISLREGYMPYSGEQAL